MTFPSWTPAPPAFELEAFQSVHLDDSEVFLCKIRNVLVDELLADESKSAEERIQAIAPVSTTCLTYFSWDGKALGRWGELMKQLGRE